jgi:hypothetical protein
MENGTRVKEKYGIFIFDIDITPCYVRKIKTFFRTIFIPNSLKPSISPQREQRNE